MDSPVSAEVMIPAILVAVAVVIGTIIFFVNKINTASAQDSSSDAGDVPVERPVVQQPAARARGARQRMVRQARPRQYEDDEDDEQQNEEIDDAGTIRKVGVKKARKMEIKAEKAAQREHDVADRQDRKQRQELLDEQRRKAAEKAERTQQENEDEELRKKEEQEQREQEEYLAMKECFEVQEEGYEKILSETESQNLLQEFINHIKERKVILLEDLAAEFNMKTQEAIKRVNELQEQGMLTGVIDDRGKFIYISQDELEGVAKFIRQRGRVSISDLAEASNTLIFLNPDAKSKATVLSPMLET